MSVQRSLLWVVSFLVSAYTVIYWNLNNRLPGYDAVMRHPGSQNIDPDKAAFSMVPHDEEALDDHDRDPHRGGPHSDYSDPYGAPIHVSGPYAGSSVVGSQVSTSYGGAAEQDNPFKQENPFDSDTEHDYRRPSPSAAGSRYAAPSAQDDYEDDPRPVHFPSGNYDRITR